jgi:serine/threonine-protein kinase
MGVGLASGNLSVWVKQLEQGPFTRISFGGQDRRPAWSPDGKQVAFVRDSQGTSMVYGRRVDGVAPERQLARLDRQVQEVTWSPDGTWLIMRTDNGLAGAGDLVGVRVGGDTTPVPLVASPFTELHPAVSPNGRWLAYTSNESGTDEVFVRPFPGTDGGRWQVSSNGGSQPLWSPDGQELTYINPANAELSVATLRLTPAFEVVARRQLFSVATFGIDPFHQSYAVLPDGKGYVFLRPQSRDPNQATPIVEGTNWFAGLKARRAK